MDLTVSMWLCRKRRGRRVDSIYFAYFLCQEENDVFTGRNSAERSAGG